MTSTSSGTAGVKRESPSCHLKTVKVCLFCDKIVISSGDEDVGRFLRLLGRFIGEGDALEELCGGRGLRQREKNGMGCCRDCRLISSSFCEAYHQLKRLELRLESKLVSLVNIMRIANRVPSRLEGLKRGISEETGDAGVGVDLGSGKIKKFKALRSKLIGTCTRNLTKKQSRVCLERKVEGSLLKVSTTPILTATLTVDSTSNEIIAAGAVPLTAGSSLGWTMYLPDAPIHTTNNLQLSTQPEDESLLLDDLNEDERPPSPVDADETNDDFDEDRPDTTTVLSSRENMEELGGIEARKPLQTLSRSHSDVGVGSSEEPTQTVLTDANESFDYSNNSNLLLNFDVEIKSENEDPVTSPQPAVEGSTRNDHSTTDGSSSSDEEPLSSYLLNQYEKMLQKPSSPQSSGMPNENPTRDRTTLESPSPHGIQPKKGTDPAQAPEPGTSGISTSRSYNFREKRKRSFAEMEDETDPQDGDDYQASDSTSSSSSDSDHSSGAEGDEPNATSTQKNFSCSVCQGKFYSPYTLKKHFQRLHKTVVPNDSEIFRCDLCPVHFARRMQLQTHKLVVHFKKKCPECGDSFKRHEYLRRHLGKLHPEIRLFSGSELICDIGACRKHCRSETALESHKKTCKGHKSGQEIFKCDICNEEFTERSKLYTHKAVHREISMFCPECGEGFSLKRQLKSHLLYHQGPEAWKFECSECQRKFPMKHLFETHMRSHQRPEEWKFECSECGKKFPERWRLKGHQRSHSKEKPFTCQFCGKNFSTPGSLKTHVKTKHPHPEELKEAGGAG